MEVSSSSLLTSLGTLHDKIAFLTNTLAAMQRRTYVLTLCIIPSIIRRVCIDLCWQGKFRSTLSWWGGRRRSDSSCAPWIAATSRRASMTYVLNFRVLRWELVLLRSKPFLTSTVMQWCPQSVSDSLMIAYLASATKNIHAMHELAHLYTVAGERQSFGMTTMTWLDLFIASFVHTFL